MNIQLNNNVFELRITPNKRKREHFKLNTQKTNENKENNFCLNNLMEVKSIADIVKQRNTNINNPDSLNTFETVRKPPKKKSKHESAGEEHCFVNPALNLNVPEKILNPFEVKRVPNIEEEHHCFSNPGLNIRSAEREQVNPFEITRDQPPPREIQGIENPGLEIQSTNLAIGVPFTPTVGCRIDFKNVPLEALTPCSMLNKKLIFSPVKKPTELTPKRRTSTLSVISEEAVDISKELECYQLELENSMNEAKATKKRDTMSLIDMKHKKTLAKRLSAGDCMKDDNNPEIKRDENLPTGPTPKTISSNAKSTEHSCQDSTDGRNECPKSSTPKTPNETCIAHYPVDDNDKSIAENPDVIYEEVEDTQVEIQEINVFKNPAPFVRNYRRDIRKPATIQNQKYGSEEKNENKDHEMLGNIRSSIRKSFRKLMQGAHGNEKRSTEELSAPENPPTTGFLSTIRRSLRRKPKENPANPAVHEISIIDCKERPIFKDVMTAEKVATVVCDRDEQQVGIFRTTTILRSSIRKSSRHVMKSVFKKNVENYDLEK